MKGRFSAKYTFLLLLVVCWFNSISSACSCNDTDRVDKLEAKVQLLELHLQALQRSVDTKQAKDTSTGTMQDYSSGVLNVDRNINESAFDVTMSPGVNQAVPVAFYGRIIAQESILPGKGQVIVFDDVVTDSGNHYSKYTGIFTVPSNGYYVFSWSIVTRHSAIFTQIVVNAIEKGSTLSHSIDEGFVTSTGVVVIYALKGDVVFIRTNDHHSEVGEIRSYWDQHSSFMGWKLC